MDEQEQIRELTRRVEELENEVQRMKTAMNMAEAKPHVSRNLSDPIGERTSQIKSFEPIKRHEDEYKNEEKPVSEERRLAAANYERKRDIEGKVGKTVMGILASVLIFVSLVLFAKMIYKYIPDGAKVGLMFAVSLCVAVVGIVKMSDKAKYNVLFTSLAGCGVGAVYISSMLTHFVFGMINQLTLMIFVLVWLAATLVLAKFKSEVFVYICNIGLIVAAFMAAAQWKGNILATCLYVAVLILLYVVKHTNDSRDYFYFLQLPVVCIILSVMHGHAEVGAVIPVVMLAITYGVLAFVSFNYYKEEAGKTAKILGIIYSVEMIVSTIVLCFIYNDASGYLQGIVTRKTGVVNDTLWFIDGASILYIGFMLAGCAVYYLAHFKKNKVLFNIWLYAVIAALPVVFVNLEIAEYVKLLPVFPVIILLGVFLKDRYARFAGYIWSGVHLALVLDDVGSPENIWIIAITLVIYAALGVAVLRLSYNWLDKYVLCFALMLYSWGILEAYSDYLYVTTRKFFSDWYLLFFVYAAISVFMNTRFFVSEKDHKAGRIIGYIVNALCLTFGLLMLRDGWLKDNIATIVLIVSVLALSFVNIRNLFNSWIDKTLVGVYTCLKYTLVTWVIMARFETVSYLVSVILIAVAIAFIVAGFKVNFRAPRIYGLVLTILCIFKLVLFDIEYDSNIMKPVGFFVAGILCFSISWIYSRLEKQLAEGH